MNIAFPAFLILLLILPGFIFLSAHERKENTAIERKPFDVSSAIALFFALLIHLILSGLFSFFGLTPDYSLPLKLALGLKTLTYDLESIEDHALAVTLYFLLSFSLPYLLGKFTQWVRFSLNPYKDSRFSFDTPWYYELKGKLSDVHDAQIIQLTCLQDLSEGTYLYYGVLEDFYLDREGQLDRVVLSDVFRRKLASDDGGQPESQNRFYGIKGDRLVLKYADIRNINIEYLYITEELLVESEINE